MEVDFIKTILKDLESKGLKRSMREMNSSQNRKIIVDGKEVLNFCSNNYLGLADDPRLAQAAIESLKKEGFGSGASRLVCGNMNAHVALEKKLAEFKGTEKCLVFSSGYMANVGIISSLCGRGDIILGDKLNHASIIDGILLSGAEFKRYPHCDMEALEGFLKNSQNYKKKLIVTDSVFSMDGDIAPLDKIVALARKYHCLVMIDEAHAFGVLGKNGKGAAEHLGLEKEIDIQMGTLSKAAGSFGAYVCGSKDLVDFLANRARSFIYTTAMPPSVAAASSAAIDIIKKEPQRRAKLLANAQYLKAGLQNLGFEVSSQTPIIPILVKDSKMAVKFSKELFEQGIFAQAIRPPTVPENTARIRVTVMATHSREDLDLVLKAFRKLL
ncbi:MAG: 8-amino-7-oxononanoate synthase [Candidatus Omnitrophota bacterium]